MGRVFSITLEGDKIYSCKHCQMHLALEDDVLWKTFDCKPGKAYLFDKIVNVTEGKTSEQMMPAGMCAVIDLFCVGCLSNVGWKYEAASEKNQDMGCKFILSRCKVMAPPLDESDDDSAGDRVLIGGSDSDDA